MKKTQPDSREYQHDRAVQILTEVREILTGRLMDRVLELGGDLLDDARGDSFSGEIETLYEHIGAKLNQVNTMLAGLPPRAESPSVNSGATSPGPAPHADFSKNATRPRSSFTETSITVQPLNDEAPETYVPSSGKTDTNSYPLFVQDIIRRDIAAAGRKLATILSTAQTRGELAALRFREQLDQDPGFLSKIQALRKALNTGAANQSLLLLWDCFGLRGEESLPAMKAMQGWL